jgi:glycosyltransferase involved in cell wall biosynthesis
VRVLHISPTHFDNASVIGGAERYAWELARAMARDATVTFLTFGPEARQDDRDGVRVETLRRRRPADHHHHPLAAKPLSLRFVRAIRRADVVHCHQVSVFSTNAGVLFGRLLGRPVFVTDLGGGHPYAPSNYVPLMRLATGFLLISEYSRHLWAAAPASRRPARLDVIYGGVDTDRFSPGGTTDPTLVLYVGRLLPHKGIEHLIDAIVPPLTLRIVGRPYDQTYVAMLRDRAAGKPVVFEPDVDDRGLVDRYRSALVSVLPSVSTDWRGHTTPVAELLGLVVLEAMACGTPVIVSRTASLPELVEDGLTGFVVPPGDGAAIRARLLDLHANPDRAAALGHRARAAVIDRFTWSATARRCLDAYRRP